MTSQAQRRVGILFALFVCLIVVAGARAAYLGVVRGDGLKRAAASQQSSEVSVPGRRGTIFDRHNIELAVSEPAEDVAATPYLVRDPLGIARRISRFIGTPAEELAQKLARRDTGFVYLARQLPVERAHAIERMHIEGFSFTPTQRRVYPQGWLASQLIGTVGLDGQALSGFEYSRGHVLRGTDGKRHVVRDALGEPISVTDVRAGRSGRDVRLTLDAGLQSKVEDVLAEVGRDYRPKGATAIVMDPRTGGILSLANWPRVDANDVGGAPAYARQDRAVGYDYEPGSTFKAFTVAGALQDGLVGPDTAFDLPPEIKVADRTIGEAHARGAVRLTTAQILAQSSNVGAIKIGLELGRKRFDYWIRKFGFGRPTGVDLPGEERGQVLTLDHYSGSTMGNLPIGQGLSVTPLQVAAAYGAIANGGILRTPHVTSSIAGQRLAMGPGRRVISAATAASLRRMLEGVFSAGGTASDVAPIPGYKLAGKTGTANKIDPATGEYSKYRVVASFVGFAPADNPRVLVAVMVDEPQGSGFGGVVAAPAFGKIMTFALPYLGIPPS
jgi:cell division protein FtsI (penicillin-binding protein 3)